MKNNGSKRFKVSNITHNMNVKIIWNNVLKIKKKNKIKETRKQKKKKKRTEK